jgi:hypothetical protein
MIRRALTVPLALVLTVAAASDAHAFPASWSPLSGGQQGRYSWAVKVGSRDGAGLSREVPTPCLRIAITIRHGRFSRDRSIFRGCAAAPGRLRRSDPPLLAGGSQLGPTDRAGMTVFGIATGPAARQVHLTFADGGDAVAALRPIGSAGSPATGVGNLRYAVLALPGVHCIERMVSRSADGTALWEGAPEGHSC